MTIDPGLRRLALGTMMGAFPGDTVPPWLPQLLADGLAGITLFGANIVDPVQLIALTKALHRVRPQVLIGIDEEGGDVTRLGRRTGSPYPGNAALGAVDDPQLTRSVHAAIGADLAALGITLNLAPVADVNTEDDNPIIGTRSFGSTPALVSRHTAAAVTGLQSAGVAACAKHFPGHGATRTDSHLALPTVDATLDVLRSRDLPPFAAAIDAGVAAIMTAHLSIPSLTGELPATFSRAVLHDLLRREYAHSGAIITDALEMRGAVGAAGSVGNAAVLALAAGADVLCLGARVTPELVESVVAEIAAGLSDGRLSLDRLTEAAEHTSALAAASAPPVALSPGDHRRGLTMSGGGDIGMLAARRALRVEGSPDGFSGAFVVRVYSGSSVAQGGVPWGLFGNAVTVATSSVSVNDLVTRAGARPIVLVGRRLHRDPDTRNLIELLATRHTVAVVEMGWPSSWRPAGVRAFLTTFGAGDANGRAAAHALSLEPGIHHLS